MRSSSTLAPTLDHERVAALLRRRLGGDIGELVRIEHGHWSRAFAFVSRFGRMVIRFDTTDAAFRKDLLVSTHPAGTFLTPRLIEIGAALGYRYAISQHVAGVHLDELGHRRMRQVLPSLLASLDGLRRVEVSGTGFGEWSADDGNAAYPDWPAYLLDVGADRPADRTSGWRDRLATYPSGTATFGTTLDRLGTLAGGLAEVCSPGRHLVHGDLLNYNVLVADGRVDGGAGGAVLTLLDWGWAKYGDFLYDIARLCFWAPAYPCWRGIDFRREALRYYRRAGVEVPGFDQRLRCYQVHVGLSAQVHRAFRGQWAGFGAIAARTLRLATRGW